MNLTDMSKIAMSTSRLRGKFYADLPDNAELFFKDLAGEVTEATAAGVLHKYCNKGDSSKNKLAEELADVIITTMVISARYEIDLEKAVVDKLAYNIERENIKECC